MWLFERLQDVVFSDVVQNLPIKARQEVTREFEALQRRGPSITDVTIQELEHLLRRVELSLELSNEQRKALMVTLEHTRDRVKHVYDCGASDYAKADAMFDRRFDR